MHSILLEQKDINIAEITLDQYRTVYITLNKCLDLKFTVISYHKLSVLLGRSMKIGRYKMFNVIQIE